MIRTFTSDRKTWIGGILLPFLCQCVSVSLLWPPPPVKLEKWWIFRAFLEILKDQIKKPVDFLGRKRKKLSGHLCPIIKPRLAAFYCHFCGGTFPFPYYDPSKTATIPWIFLADHACNNAIFYIRILNIKHQKFT